MRRRLFFPKAQIRMLPFRNARLLLLRTESGELFIWLV